MFCICLFLFSFSSGWVLFQLLFINSVVLGEYDLCNFLPLEFESFIAQFLTSLSALMKGREVNFRFTAEIQRPGRQGGRKLTLWDTTAEVSSLCLPFSLQCWSGCQELAGECPRVLPDRDICAKCNLWLGTSLAQET